MPAAVKEERYELNADAVGMASRDLAAETADGTLVPVWEYPVPVGYSLVFTGEDILSAYMEDDEGAPAECTADQKIGVIIMDSSKQNVRSILNPMRYGGVKDFADVGKLTHLDIAPGEQIIAREGERVCIVFNSPGTIKTLDVSDSFFSLTCKRIRHTLFD